MKGTRITDKYIFFWGSNFSQWAKSFFSVNNVQYNCCEQFMMAEKARLFNDENALDLILQSTSPKEQKQIGRQVKGFNIDLWNNNCRDIVYQGNLAKFKQNPSMQKELMETGNRTIVEASPYDKIWGIGLSKEDPQVLDPSKWKGTNWLGIALMQVRSCIQDGIELDAFITGDTKMARKT